MVSFDNINTLAGVAPIVNRLCPESNCYAVTDTDGRAKLVLQHGEYVKDVFWNSPLYHGGVVRLLEILAENKYDPILTLRKDALVDCLLDLTIDGETVSSGSCTMGVAVMGAFYAIGELDPEITP